jgi:uncharacterized protein (TIGR02996 family)
MPRDLRALPFVLKVTPTNSNASQYLTFEDAVVTIGRAKDNHVVLDHATVELHHARLLRTVWIEIEVMPGAPPVLLDRKPVERRSTGLNDGHVITIGRYTIELLDREAPNERERTFIEAIQNSPNDDSTRVVYGDWLEEVGRKEEAEFLRSQLALKSLHADDPRFQELSTRIRDVGEKLSLSWRRTVARPALENCGGMQYQVQCPKKWDDLAPTLSPKERFCDSCQRNVHYATDLDEARMLARLGECLVIDIVQPRRANDLNPPPVVIGNPPPPLPPGQYVPTPGMYLPPPTPPGWKPDE